ncbi:hypothetical protein ACHAQA_003495 [Verticillium albo-atrum]
MRHQELNTPAKAVQPYNTSHTQTSTMMADTDARNFIEYVNRSLREEEEFHFLRFEYLQRLNLTHFHVTLARLKSKFKKQGTCSPEEHQLLQKLLRDYATAIRDYRALRTSKAVPASDMGERKALLQAHFQSPADHLDPFHSHYAFFEDQDETAHQIDPLRRALMRRLPRALAFSREEKRRRAREYADGKAPHHVSALVDRLVRFLVALTGGGFLVGPMMIMALRPSLTKSLVAVSAALVLFSLVLSFGIRVSNIETLVATATYAAVLVVFVGTSSGGIGG